jgi:hypothetical protein
MAEAIGRPLVAALFRRNATPICPRGGGRMEPSGKDGRGGEVSLAAPGHDGMPVRSRPTTALAIWSSVLQPGALSAGRQQGEHDRRRACRINTRAPRDKQNSRMPRWQARTSGRPIASPIRACAPAHGQEHARSLSCSAGCVRLMPRGGAALPSQTVPRARLMQH